jgi:hypothetical protein
MNKHYKIHIGEIKVFKFIKAEVSRKEAKGKMGRY